MFKEKESKHKDSESQNPSAVEPSRKLSVRDVALGLGRKATDEELEEYLNRPSGNAVPLKKAITQIKSKLRKNRQQRKKWK